jgi:hypothetical protein
MPMRGVRITLAEIEQAWPSGVHDLLESRSVRLADTDAPPTCQASGSRSRADGGGTWTETWS